MDARNKIFAVVGTVAIVATAGIIGLVLFTQKDSSANARVTSPTTSLASSSTSANSTQTGTNSSASANSSSYKDGTYTSSAVSYSVPHGGQNSLKATVVISNGKISSVTATDNYTDRESGMYVSSFEDSVSGDASGQSIGSYSPSRIGGASLTTTAFDEAITDVASQAKA